MRGVARGRGGAVRPVRPAVFRGGGAGGGGKVFVPRPPFDMFMCEDVFPRAAPPADETHFQQAVCTRNKQLTPTSQQQAAVSKLMSCVCGVLEALIANPADFDACHIEEYRQVGSYKKGTMHSGHCVADVVAILKTLPTRQAVEALAARALQDLRQCDGGNDAQLLMLDHTYGFDLRCGAEVSDSGATVRLLVTTVHQNMRKLGAEQHVDHHLVRLHLAAVRHSRWFEENVHHSSIKILIRLLHDIRRRFSGLTGLSPWIIDLLAHHAVVKNRSQQALPVHTALRRCFQLLASGLFLPGSAGISDPCEGGGLRVHMSMSLKQQDVVCMTAQTLLRVIAHGGLAVVLALDDDKHAAITDVANEASEWSGVRVLPPSPVYNCDAVPAATSAVTSSTQGDAAATQDVVMATA